TGSADGTARVWNWTVGRAIAVHAVHVPVGYAAFSSDGARVVVTEREGEAARVLNASTGKEIAIFRGQQYGIWSAAFSPNGARVVTAAADGIARLWDTATGEEVVALKGHRGPGPQRCFYPRRGTSDDGSEGWKRAGVGRGHRTRDRHARGKRDFGYWCAP